MIVVGSANPAKVRPAREVFARFRPELEVVGMALSSGVREQPLGFEETLAGARNRAAAALAQPGTVFGLGLEGGVEEDARERAWLFGVVVVASTGRTSFSRSASLELPPGVGRRVLGGEELGPVMDELSGVRDSKQKAGTVGFLTNALLSRADVWRQTLILALAPHLKPALYPENA